MGFEVNYGSGREGAAVPKFKWHPPASIFCALTHLGVRTSFASPRGSVERWVAAPEWSAFIDLDNRGVGGERKMWTPEAGSSRGACGWRCH